MKFPGRGPSVRVVTEFVVSEPGLAVPVDNPHTCSLLDLNNTRCKYTFRLKSLVRANLDY